MRYARGPRNRRGEEDTHVIGFPGCYDNEYAIRLMLALARHPNVGAVLAVGLGCEYTSPRKIAEVVPRRRGRPADWFYIQEQGGTRASIAARQDDSSGSCGRTFARQTPRVPMRLRDLVVGCECGGSDGTSGLAGNPVVGRFFDRLVDAGGTAIFEETVEMIGLRDIMTGRAASPQAAVEIGAAYDKAVAYCQAVRQYSVSPGNFAGGLTTIEEKWMGAFAKSGSRPIQGVISVAERAAACRAVAAGQRARPALHAVRLHQPQRHRRHHGPDRPPARRWSCSSPGAERDRLAARAAHQGDRQQPDLRAHGGGHGLRRRAACSPAT